eukprot:TRINITY_DN50734_c0_g1_i1.p1 TRINITY_DN50734_c0_g1~~TRINITY_DN50734_c0_g1_i1.p1  ORF type:complete len:467 (+),score=161.28 TRINITY_DN50734_c0_g1_i1:97-1401(+)
MAGLGDKAEDREAFNKFEAFGADKESVGWLDSVVMFDDFHAKAGEVCSPYVEHTGITIEGVPTGPIGKLGGPESFKVNFFPQKTAAMLRALGKGLQQKTGGSALAKAAKEAQKQTGGLPDSPKAGGAGAGDMGMLLAFEASMGNTTVTSQHSSIGDQQGLIVSVDRTDITVPFTGGRCQLDARAVYSTLSEDGDCDLEGADELFAAKLQCSNWSVKAEVPVPDFDGAAREDPAGYLAAAGGDAALSVSVNAGKWLPAVLGEQTLGVKLGSGGRQFGGWGLNWLKNVPEGSPLGGLGIEKLTAGVTYERSDEAEETQGPERFYSPSYGGYTTSASVSLADGRMFGVSVSDEAKEVGISLPVPECSWWQSASLRLRHGIPNDADEPKQIGIGFFWQAAAYAAQVCVQLRHNPQGSGWSTFIPRAWVNLSLGAEGED